MIELDSDYDMTVDNMVPLTGEYKGWTNHEGEFYSPEEDVIKMNYLLLLHCFLFVITLSEYLICMKYINNAYNYKNEWFNMLLSVFFTPFYCFLFIIDINRKKLKTYFLAENRKKLLFPIGMLTEINSEFLENLVQRSKSPAYL